MSGAGARPSVSALKYSPVPPTRIAVPPRAVMVSMHASASCAQRPTEQRSDGIKRAEQVMRRGSALGLARRSRNDFETGVDLHGVRVHDFTAELPSSMQRQRRLAAGGGPGQE